MSQRTTKTRFVWGLVPLVLLTVVCLGQESKNETAELSHHELMLRYAKAKVTLAEVELQQAEQASRVTRGLIPSFVLERLRSNLTVAKEHSQEASLASSDGPLRVRLCHAEEKIRLAKLELASGEKLASDGEISELELKRLQLKYRIANLNLALLKNPKSFVTLLDQVQGDVDRLGEEMITLDQRISKLEESIELLSF